MLTPGTILQSRYQIIRPLGAGGMGAVYQARDLRLQKIVALKENLGGNVRQFQQEALLLANLSHPNLPRVTDHFVESNNAQYLVMDYIEGEDLQAHIDRAGALPEAQALAWFDQILAAVAYLHSCGVIHRDIKPANIKITPQGTAMLVDFGIAKVYRPGQLTASSARFGSSGFASPEHYRGGTDQRSDIYSLGATLYALLTRHAPPDALALAGGSAMLVPPRQLNPTLSISAEQAILRALAVAPDQRWQTAAELRAALRQPVAQPQSVSPPLSPTIPVIPPEQLVTKRARTATLPVFATAGIIIAGAILIVTVFGAVIFPMLAQRPTASPTRFSPETPTATKFAVAVPLTPTIAIPTVDASAPTATATPGTPGAYTVQWGDWARKIAEKHGITVEELLAANPGVNPSTILPGQVLKIPTPGGVVPTATMSPSCTPTTTYTVQQADWFYSIARKFNISVAQLQAANPGVNPNFLYPGQVLGIPGGGCITPEATPSGSTTPTSGSDNPSTYTVQAGDTLASIAVRFKTTPLALQIANNLPNPSAIYPGLILIVPSQ